MSEFEERVRSAMHDQASQVRPSERLEAIRRRTAGAAGRQGHRWWVPAMSGLAAGLVAGGVLAVTGLPGGGTDGSAVVADATPTPSTLTSSKPPTPTPTRSHSRTAVPPTPTTSPTPVVPPGRTGRSHVVVTSPPNGTTFDGPVVVTGESNTFEATVSWLVLEDGTVVREGYAMGGSYGEWQPFRFSVRLPAGSYTVAVFESNAKDGSQQYVNTRRVTVE